MNYLLWQLAREDHRSPLIEQAMRSIARRPARVVDRAAEVLAASGMGLSWSHIRNELSGQVHSIDVTNLTPI